MRILLGEDNPGDARLLELLLAEVPSVQAELVRVGQLSGMLKILGEEQCDLVVCLSHLGLRGYDDAPGDEQLAEQVPGIDLIVGGHSHTFMETPLRVRHGARETLVFQVGWAGINLGRIDFHLRPGQVVAREAALLPVGPPVPPARHV